MKKILLLMTSPKVGGNGDALIEAAAETALGCGAEVKRLNVRELDIHPCRGCYGCAKTGECVQKDDFRTVLSALHEWRYTFSRWTWPAVAAERALRANPPGNP